MDGGKIRKQNLRNILYISVTYTVEFALLCGIIKLESKHWKIQFSKLYKFMPCLPSQGYHYFL